MANPDFQKVVLGNDTIGFVELSGFEIPERLTLGGKQNIVVSEFIGFYKREVQTLGAQPRPIEWEGRFLYDSALDRARLLEDIMNLGQKVTLTWADVQLDVVISVFEYNVRHKNDIGYRICLEVVGRQFNARDFSTIPASKDFVSTSIVIKLVSAIITLVNDIKRGEALFDQFSRGDINSILAGITNITNIIGSVPGGLANMDNTNLQLILDYSTLAAQTAQGIAARIETYASDPASAGLPIDSIHDCLSSLKSLKDLIRRYTSPIASTSTPITTDNVFKLSLRTYGTIDYWDKILDQNNLTEITLTGPKPIQLPSIAGQPASDPKNPKTVYDVALPITTLG